VSPEATGGVARAELLMNPHSMMPRHGEGGGMKQSSRSSGTKSGPRAAAEFSHDRGRVVPEPGHLQSCS
jgi:hypothetical protein